MNSSISWTVSVEAVYARSEQVEGSLTGSCSLTFIALNEDARVHEACDDRISLFDGLSEEVRLSIGNLLKIAVPFLATLL